MKVSKQAKRRAKALFGAAHVNGVLDENKLRQVVKLLVEGRPRGCLGILSHLKYLTKLDVERQTARIESPAPLGAEMETKLKETLTRRYGAGLHVSFQVNPALIGGLRIRVGSDVYDGTIAGRLKQLEESLAQ